MSDVIQGSIKKDTTKTMPEGNCVDHFTGVNADDYVLDYMTREYYERTVGIHDDLNVSAQKTKCDTHHWFSTYDCKMNTLTVDVVKGDIQHIKDLITDAIVESDGCINWKE